MRMRPSHSMFTRRYTSLRWMAAGAFIVASSLPALASLGGNTNSVEADRAQMNAAVRVSQHDTYAVDEIRAPEGTVVKEFVSPEGKVFAVAWHGQFPPQMQQILGAYFQQYTAALQAQQKHYGHPPLDIETPSLVVQTGGHMRAYAGRAYLPDSLPPGLTADQIQ
jgi:hypothetical protein